MSSEQFCFISPRQSEFDYMGRIDFGNPEAPTLVYAASNVRFRTAAKEAYLLAENHRSYFENALGILVDGAYRGKILLHDSERLRGESPERFLVRLDPISGKKVAEDMGNLPENARVYDLTPFLDGEEHEITVFKRMDACHYVTFWGLILPGEAFFGAPRPKPNRRIEVYGDSVSCGEVSEAVALCGMADPEGHDGIYSNSFYSYSWILARKLGAQLHNVSQGGIALLDGQGYFNMPDARGMLSTYDKVRYQPSLGALSEWDFSEYMPNVVIVAIGQNDHHPENYMKENPTGEKARQWKEAYKHFLGLLRGKYPRAEIILTTTILGHDAEWDEAIDEIARESSDSRIHHFLYSRNGCGTCGHIRRPEAEEMAEELARFIESLGEGIWEEIPR